MENKAIDFFNQGYSCSEAILKTAAAKGLFPEDLIKMGTAFSGGMSSGCLCGAITGAQLVISYNLGRNDIAGNSVECKKTARKFIEKFKARHKYTCCRILSKKYEFNTPERRQNCANLVNSSSEILNEIIKQMVKV